MTCGRSMGKFTDLEASHWTVLGVALLRVPGRQLTDSLMLGSDLLRALHESWAAPALDCKCKLHIFDVVDFVALDEPVRAQTVLPQKLVRSEVVELNPEFVQGLLSCHAKRFCPVSGTSTAAGQLDSVVLSWVKMHKRLGCDGMPSLQQRGQLMQWGVRCFPAVGKLMSRSGCTSIMLPPRQDLDSFASACARHLHQVMFGGATISGPRFRYVRHKPKSTADIGTELDMFAPERFRALSDFLCKVAPDIIQQHPSADTELSSYVHWLQNMQKKFSSSNTQLAVRHGGRHQMKYKMSTLIHCLRLSIECTGDSSIPAVVNSALDVVCDRDIAKIYKDLLADPGNTFKLPSPSTLSKKRMMLDCGFMLLMRTLNSAKASRFGMSDSSPQLKKDWYIQIQCTIKDEDLVAVLRATHTLASTKHLFGSETRKLATEFLHTAIDTHTCVPATLAWRRASLLHKLECMVHSFLLEVPGQIAGVEKHLATFHSWTTDQGVESLQADTEFVSVGDLLEWLPGGASERASVKQHSLEELDLPEDGPPPILIESRQEQFAKQHLMPNTLWVPGILHILHKATETLLEILESWEGCVKEAVNAILKFLNKSYCREAFVSVCLLGKGDSASQWIHLFASFSSKVVEWRWGSLLVALSHMVPLQAPLVRYWNHNAMFKDFGHSKQKGQEEGGDDIPSVTEAIKSPFVWAYAAMVLLLGEVVVSMTALAESCVCHSSPDLNMFEKGAKSKDYFRRKAKQFDSGEEICPNSGKQAPAFAAGRAIEYLEHLLNLCEGKVLEHASLLDASEQSKLLRDFSKGRSHLIMFISARLRFWQQLPYILCGLAHHDRKAALETGKRALALFQACSEGTRHHRVTWLFLESGSLMRHALVEFLAGRSLEDSPWEFQLAVARLGQVFTAERLMEAQHKTMGQAARHACRTSEAYAAICLRGRELLRRIDRNPDVFIELEGHCYSVRTPRKVMEALDLSLHPGIEEELTKKAKLRHQAVCKVVYHSDLVRCHRSMKGLADLMLQRSGCHYQGQGDADAQITLSEIKEEPQQPDAHCDLPDDSVEQSDAQIYQMLVYKHAQDHVKEMLQAGGWYSSASVGEQLTSHDTCLRLRTQLTMTNELQEDHDDTLQSGVALADNDAHSTMALLRNVRLAVLDFAALSIPQPATLVGDKHFFFNLFSSFGKRIEKGKYVKLLSGVQTYTTGDIVVTLHDVVSSDNGEVKVPLQSATLTVDTGKKGKSIEDATSIWRLPQDLSHDVLRDSLLKWECTGNLEYGLSALVCQSLRFQVWRIHEIVSKMMNGRCFGQAGENFITNRPDQVQVLQALCQQGLCEFQRVSRAHEAATYGYKFTQLGLDSLLSFNILKSPAYFFHSRPLTDSVSISDFTTYEALDHMLFTAGWQVHVLRYGQRAAKAGVVPYQFGGPKHWWMRETKATISRLYICALLTVDASWPPVQHFLTDVSYTHFVKHKEWPQSIKQRRQAALKDSLESIEADMAAVERPRLKRKASARQPAKRARAAVLDQGGSVEAAEDIVRASADGDDDGDTNDANDDDVDGGDMIGTDDLDNSSDDMCPPVIEPSPGEGLQDEDNFESGDDVPLATLTRLGGRPTSPTLEEDLRSHSGSAAASSTSSSQSSSSSTSSDGSSDRAEAPRCDRQAAATIDLHGETFTRLRQKGDFSVIEIFCPKCKALRKCSHANMDISEVARRLLLWRKYCPQHKKPVFGGLLLRNFMDPKFIEDLEKAQAAASPQATASSGSSQSD